MNFNKKLHLKKNVRDHVQSTIKKNNKQYLEKIKKPLSEVHQHPPIASSSPVRLTVFLTDETRRLKRSKIPYHKE